MFLKRNKNINKILKTYFLKNICNVLLRNTFKCDFKETHCRIHYQCSWQQLENPKVEHQIYQSYVYANY